nr:MAG TPA: hypothetical protein [Caudoviricetes sp.]
MSQMIADEIMRQVLAYLVGALLAAVVAAVGVGGVVWRKLHVNDMQNKRMDELLKAIHANELVLETMACHQLQLACKRAVDRGCISMQEKQDITELWDCYHAKGWNGPGEVAYKSIQNLPVKEDC